MSTTALTKVGTKNAEQVVLLDAAGDQVTSFGGGTQYADGAAAATPTGTQINWNDGGTQRAVSAAKPLPVTASIDTTGLATSTIQTDGTQKTQIVDSGGEAATVTGGKLDVNASIDTTGLATAANQQTDALTDTELRATPVPVSATDLDIRNLTATDVVTANLSATDNAVLDSIDTSTAAINTKTPALGQALAAASVPVVLPAAQITTLTPPAAITGFALETTATSIKTAVETIDNAIAGNEMQVDVVTSALPSGASTAAKQPALGTAGTASADVITVQGIASMTALKVDGSGVTQPVSGTVTVTATNLDVQSGGADLATSTQAGAIQTAVELIDDTVKVLGTDTYTEAATKGLVIGAVRRDADTTLVDTTNEIGPVQMNAAGQLKVEVFSGETLPVSLASTVVTATDLDIRNLVNTDVVTAELSATDNAVLDAIAASVAAIDTDTSTIITNTGNSATSLGIMDDWDNGASDGASVSGDTAHDAADAGEPVKIGGKAVSAEPTAVAANDRVNALFDLVGKLIVLPYANPENFVSGAITSAMTGTTSTSLIAAPAAGLRNYITTIVVSNAHGTVNTDVVIQDGSGGTTLMTIPAACLYGGAVINLPVPLRQPTTATAIFCANVTTGASTKVSAVGYKGV